MRLDEFLEAVESYGVRVPPSFAVGGKTHETDRRVLGVISGPPGFPGHRGYTARQVRRVVSWLLLGLTAGSSKGSTEVRLQAMRLLAAAPEGYVVMADGRAWWSLVGPVHALRTKCAVAVPVPQWRH